MPQSKAQRANELISALPRAEFAKLAPHLEDVRLTPRTILAQPGVPLSHAYFPHAGVICLMAVLRNGVAETATIGPEGFVGFEALLGGEAESQRVLVQVGGTASRIPIRKLLAAAETSSTLRNFFLGYVRYLLVQILQSVACNGLHSIDKRCARWLLMAHDRAKADTFGLTHAFFAEMLGVHRPNVTVVARRLQKAGLIRYSRGQITIANRKGLERAACECYGTVREAHGEMLASLTRKRRPAR
jgi:CRP-like cAMP-binding protein